MDNKDYSRKKKHLTADERSKIEILLKIKKTPSEIARELGRNRSVITREIKRNSVTQLDSELRECKRYYADAASRQYEERRSATGCVSLSYYMVKAIISINNTALCYTIENFKYFVDICVVAFDFSFRDFFHKQREK